MRVWMAVLFCGGCVALPGQEGLEGRNPREAAEVPPQITWAEAEARSGWDSAFWELEAEVEPGHAGIISVAMEFYDEAHERCFIERIELFPSSWEDDVWELDWRGSHSVLDPWHDQYTALVVATDSDGRTDVVEIWADAL